MSVEKPTQRVHLPGRALALLLLETSAAGSPDAHGALPKTYFGGRFRSVDFALSNCVNSGIRRIGVISPERAHSIRRHLQRSWSFLNADDGGFIDLMLPAQAAAKDVASRPEFAETPALRLQQLLSRSSADFVLVLTGEHIYKMNYALMLGDHVAKGRPCSVACIESSPETGPAGNVVQLDAVGRITDLQRAPHADAGPAALTGDSTTPLLRSMGICIFDREYLSAALAQVMADGPSAQGHDHELAHNIVLRAVHEGQATAHSFARSCVGAVEGQAPYWRDVGSIDNYWQAHIDLTTDQPQLDLYDPHWPLRAQQTELPPAKFKHDLDSRRGVAVESLVSGGCIISGSVRQAVLFASVRVHSQAQVESSVLLPQVEVGRHARLRRVVVDRDCVIPDGLVIGEDAQADAARFTRTERGITLVTAAMLARLSAPPADLAATSEQPAATPCR